MDDESIAVVEQRGRRFVAHLLHHPAVRGEGATQEEALQHLAHQLRSRSRQKPGTRLVQSVTVRIS